jgi:predicted nucleotidyltransferase component of viral defense system
MYIQQTLDKDRLEKILDTFPKSKLILNTADELTFFTQGNVKITFLYYPFKKLEPDKEEEGVYVGSLNDLIANKFYVIGRRAEIRDYIDIYHILKIKSLEECINIAIKKYGELISKKVILGQLKYLDDLDFKDPVFLASNLSKEELGSFLSEKIEGYMSDI